MLTLIIDLRILIIMEILNKDICHIMGYDEYFIGNSNGLGIGTSTGETGFLGKTLFPGIEGQQNSMDDSIYIIINSGLSELGRAETFSHEGYGHAYIYVVSEMDRSMSSHNYDAGLYDRNRILYNIINKSINETTRNFFKK